EPGFPGGLQGPGRQQASEGRLAGPPVAMDEEAKDILLEDGTEALPEQLGAGIVLGPVDDPQGQGDPTLGFQLVVEPGLDREPVFEGPSGELAILSDPDIKHLGVSEVFGPD